MDQARSRPSSTEPGSAPLNLEEAESLLQEVAGAEEGSAAPAGLGSLLDDAFGEGRRLGRLGDCALIVSHDGLTAWLRGPVPENATYEGLLAFVQEAGVCFGIVPGRLRQAVPRRGLSRGAPAGRSRQRGAHGAGQDTQVARGIPPEPPPAARVEYSFPLPADGATERFAAAMSEPRMPVGRQPDFALPLVTPGTVLARVIVEHGLPGKDVFGMPVEAPPPAGAQLRAGERIEVAADGQSCRAEVLGYAGLRQETLVLIPPVWVARDLMTACFVYQPGQPEPPVPSVDQILAVLTSLEVTYGIDAPAIEQLVADLVAGRSVQACTVVARGQAAVPGSRVVWRYVCDPELTRYCGEIERILAAGRTVEYLQEYASGLAGKPVHAGEALALREEGQPGTQGRDVYGEEFLPQEPRQEPPEAGDHVSEAADGTAFSADLYGYLGIRERLLTVVPALWVDPELQAAYFVNLPQLGPHQAPTAAEIDQLLALAGVRFGVDRTAVAVLCERLQQDLPAALAEPIARGRLPQRGTDGRFEFALSLEPQATVFRADGSVDFHALNVAVTVRADELLGVSTVPLPGSPGSDLRGRPLAAVPGMEVAVTTGKGVRTHTRNDGITWYQAETAGELVHRDRRGVHAHTVSLAVHRVMVVPGDVDFRTGSIDFDGSVDVRGAVRSGFTVKAAGDIRVGDTVENGARLEAGGSAAVAHGIVGSKTLVVAGDAVYAKFVQQAEVRAGGDVVVSQYLREARVHSGSEVRVPGHAGSRKSGAILGGLTAAARCIHARRVGAESSTVTLLVGGVDAALLQRAARLQRFAEQGDAVLRNALKAVSPGPLDRRQLRGTLLGLVLRAKGPRRQVLTETARKLLLLQARCEEATADRCRILAELDALARTARVVVDGAVEPRTVVRIGACTRRIQDEDAVVRGVRFVLADAGAGKCELRMEAC